MAPSAESRRRILAASTNERSVGANEGESGSGSGSGSSSDSDSDSSSDSSSDSDSSSNSNSSSDSDTQQEQEQEYPPKLKDIELRKLRTDSLQVLESLEAEHRHDLALHLYSTFLIRSKKPYTFPLKWNSWPVDMSIVDDPKTSKVYMDEDQITEKRRHKKSKHKNPESQNTETLSDPKLNLEVELDAYFANKINKLIFEFKEATGEDVEPIINPPIALPSAIRDKIMGKIEELAKKLNDAQRPQKLYQNISWREMLMTEGSLKALDICEKMFVNHGYEYERLESDDEEIENNGDEVDDEDEEEESEVSDESESEDGQDEIDESDFNHDEPQKAKNATRKNLKSVARPTSFSMHRNTGVETRKRLLQVAKEIEKEEQQINSDEFSLSYDYNLDRTTLLKKSLAQKRLNLKRKIETTDRESSTSISPTPAASSLSASSSEDEDQNSSGREAAKKPRLR